MSNISPKAKALSARLSAVQAVYQNSQNIKPIHELTEEYALHRSDMEVNGEALVEPDVALMKRVLTGVDAQRGGLNALLDEHLKKGDDVRVIEPLLRAILLCGTYELTAEEVDKPIVINDYLNVAHAFYEQGEVNLMNAVLDKVAKGLVAG